MRGWLYQKDQKLFQADRRSETASMANLRARAAPGKELTFTVVPEGTGIRTAMVWRSTLSARNPRRKSSSGFSSALPPRSNTGKAFSKRLLTSGSFGNVLSKSGARYLPRHANSASAPQASSTPASKVRSSASIRKHQRAQSNSTMDSFICH
jgi:hypothetical protein